MTLFFFYSGCLKIKMMCVLGIICPVNKLFGKDTVVASLLAKLIEYVNAHCMVNKQQITVISDFFVLLFTAYKCCSY